MRQSRDGMGERAGDIAKAALRLGLGLGLDRAIKK